MAIRLSVAVACALLAVWAAIGQNREPRRRTPAAAECVSRLGLAWAVSPGNERGFESTPLVQDGVIYATGGWSVVFAVDARTGKLKWRWDPAIPRNIALCCGGDTRGLALHAKLWEVQLPLGMATPVTWALDGRQYVTVLAGRNQSARMYTFTLDGSARLP